MNHQQVNVRVPAHGRDLLQRVAQRLRDDRTFAPKLERWLAELSDPTAGPTLSAQVEALERRVAALEGGRGAQWGDANTPMIDYGNPQGTPGDTPPNLFGNDMVEPEGFTTGTGRGRRLTLQGENELACLIREGQTDADIARALDVKTFTVKQRRKKLID